MISLELQQRIIQAVTGIDNLFQVALEFRVGCIRTLAAQTESRDVTPASSVPLPMRLTHILQS